MNTYHAYIGQGTVSNRSAALDGLPKGQRREAHWGKRELVGVWAGVAEEVTRYGFEAPDDATALRYAYAMAVLSGNDAVLISREVTEAERNYTLKSVRPYIVATEAAYAGENRTVAADGLTLEEVTSEPGWKYTPDVRGGEVAYLAWNTGEVTPVS